MVWAEWLRLARWRGTGTATLALLGWVEAMGAMQVSVVAKMGTMMGKIGAESLGGQLPMLAAAVVVVGTVAAVVVVARWPGMAAVVATHCAGTVAVLVVACRAARGPGREGRRLARRVGTLGTAFLARSGEGDAVRSGPRSGGW